MESDLRADLEAQLAASYRIVRELGGGGMSRVFLADDLALERAVVIKVLHPELAAGVNAERFKREVLLSARLQHPHIVPVLTAGDLNGLPYYVMPFVKGESLRERIAAGPMPFAEICGIAGDVAKALGYAHSDGVVHRDIKPDNILLSGGAATVADFGIAKAISTARRETDNALTSMGMSLGTPAYMAPEQVAGDPGTDHRADIYSLGCVMYEMVTGKAVFAGKSPQGMLAAQVMETPVPVRTLRKDAPASLVNAVNACLEKEPDKRPQSAADVIAMLEQGDTHAASAGGSPKKALLWAAGLAAVAVIAGVVYLRMPRAEKPANGVVNLAVAPFEVLDPQLMLWKEGIVDVLTRNLDGAGPIKSLSPGVTIKRWEGRAERASALAFAKKVGAQLVLYGQLQPAGAGLVSAKVWIVDAERDGAPVEVGVTDSTSRMDRVTDSLSVKSLAAIGKMRTIGAAKLASLGSSSLPAIRSFLQGAQYFRRAQWDSAAASLREATTVDSTFGIAYAMLGESYGWLGETGNARQWDAFRAAGRQIRSGLSPHDSLTLTAVDHYARTVTAGANRNKEFQNAFAAAGEVTREYPDDAAAWYLYADLRYHNDRTLSQREALRNFDNAIRADSDFAPAYIHAIELAFRNGNVVGRQYAEAFLRRKQNDQQRKALQMALALTDPGMTRAGIRSVADTAALAAFEPAMSFVRRTPDSNEVVIETMARALPRLPAQMQKNVQPRLTEALSYRGHVADAFKGAIEQPSFVAAELAILGLVPADSALKLMQPWLVRKSDLSFAVIHAAAAARDTMLLRRLMAVVKDTAKKERDPHEVLMLGFFLQNAQAYETLARGDSAGALKLFDAMAETQFFIPLNQFVHARLAARTDPKRGIALLDGNMALDILVPASMLEVGRLAERIGDRERAVDAYAFVAEAWRNTDSPQLRTAVTEANTALRRMDSDGRMRATLAGQR